MYENISTGHRVWIDIFFFLFLLTIGHPFPIHIYNAHEFVYVERRRKRAALFVYNVDRVERLEI